MPKLISRFIVLALFASLLAACGGTPAVSQPTSAPAAEVTAAPAAGATGASAARSDVTLTYTASQGWIQDAELELAQKFEEETGIHIDYQIVPADQYFTVLQTKLNSGEATDIFGGQSGKTDIQVNYNVEKNAVDLSGEEWVKRADPLSVEETTLNGKVYGLTIWDASRYVVVYNKQIFERLGLTPPKTYEEFKAICQAIKDEGITPIYEPFADGWHHVIWFAELGPRYEEVTPGLKDQLNANKATFADDPTMQTALQQFKEMYDLGFFGDNALSDSGSDTEANMAAGTHAMVLATLNLPAQIEASHPETKADTFGFFVNPLADNQISGFQPAGPSKFIYSGSQHIEEAKEYFRFLTRPDNLQYLLDNTPAFTTLNFPEVTSKFTEEQQSFLEAYPQTGTVYQISVNYLNPQWMDVGKDMVAMVSGASEPKGVLESIDQRRAEIAQTAKDPAWTQ